MRAKNDPVRVPKPDEPEASDCFEFVKPITKSVDLLLVLRETMIARVIEKLYQLGELLWMKRCRFGEEVFRWTVRAICEEVNPASWTGLEQKRINAKD